jgi:hypothetical protein
MCLVVPISSLEYCSKIELTLHPKKYPELRWKFVLFSTGADSEEPEISFENQIKLPNTGNCFKTRIENLMLNSSDDEIKTEKTNQNKIPHQMNETQNPLTPNPKLFFFTGVGCVGSREIGFRCFVVHFFFC